MVSLPYITREVSAIDANAAAFETCVPSILTMWMAEAKTCSYYFARTATASNLVSSTGLEPLASVELRNGPVRLLRYTPELRHLAVSRLCRRCAKAGSEPDCSQWGLDLIAWQHCSPIPSERPAAHARRYRRSAGALRPGSVQTSKAREVGPRFSEFPGCHPASWVPSATRKGGRQGFSEFRATRT